MSRREYEGRSAAEAAIKACEELGVPRSALRYEVVSDAGAGPLDRRVLIAVDVDASVAAGASGAGASAQERPEGAGRERGRPERGRGGPGRDGGRGARGGRGRRPGGERPGRGGRGRHGEGAPREWGARAGAGAELDDSLETMLSLEEAPAAESRAPATEVALNSRGVRAKETLSEILRLMGLSLTPLAVGQSDEEMSFDLRGEDEGRVIGKKGEVLLALQFLVNRIVSRDEVGGEESEQHIVLDAADYRGRRRRALGELARRLADRARAEHKVVRLSAMSAHDRRIFHITLQDVDGVSTRSVGEGLFRSLLIIPSEYSEG